MNNPATELARIRWGPRCTEEESRQIAELLAELHGGVSKAAKAEGIDRRTLYTWRRGKATAPAKYRELLTKSKG